MDYYDELKRLRIQKAGNCNKVDCAIFRQDKFDLLWALSDDELDQPILRSGFVLPTLKIPICKSINADLASSIADFMSTYGNE